MRINLLNGYNLFKKLEMNTPIIVILLFVV